MLTEQQLRDVDVLQWAELRNEFRNADLLLGNGFSMKLVAQLSYASLFEKFLDTCNDQRRALFQTLNSTNFEEIQQILVDAERVAVLMESPLPGIGAHIHALRDGLIMVIHENHPKAADIDKAKLQALSEQFDEFGDLFTTSYDLFLYHIIMVSKDRSGKDQAVRPYNDYFWRRLDEHFLEFTGYQTYRRYKHAYYLHGALFIFQGEQLGDNERKLRRRDEGELLESIDACIRDGRLPLFVSEGTARQKAGAIAQSSYLRFALEKLREAQQSLVIYGCALRDPDGHIIETLNGTRRALAVFLYVGEKTKGQIEEEAKTIRAKLARHDVVVFDSRGLF
jgi:Domain of unknown function (DUF4917)